MDVEASTSKAHPSSGEDNQQEDSNTPSPGKPILDDFLQTGRTGRRNALPDILDKDSSHDNTADLPCQMEKLSCSGTRIQLNSRFDSI